jgi:hypothetical protein
MHLREPWDVVDGEQVADLDLGAGFFQSLAPRPVDDRLARFEIARRQRPEAAPGMDRAPAEHDAAIVLDHRADDDLGIFVMDVAALGAHQALAVVAGRDFVDRGADGLAGRTAPRLRSGRIGD